MLTDLDVSSVTYARPSSGDDLQENDCADLSSYY